MPTCIVVEKASMLKETTIKEYNETELYKKCGFKKADGFDKHAEWTTKIDKQSYLVKLYGKTDGRANNENKYDFPPPADNTLFFGSCLVIAFHKNESSPCDLTIELWLKIYEKLFGGFEDLAATQAEDDNEIDELANVPTKYKTKSGYLKDGFIVSDTEDLEDEDNTSDSFSGSDEADNGSGSGSGASETQSDEIVLEDITSELDEEEYEYSDEEELEA